MYILAQCYYEVKGDYIANNVTTEKSRSQRSAFRYDDQYSAA